MPNALGETSNMFSVVNSTHTKIRNLLLAAMGPFFYLRPDNMDTQNDGLEQVTPYLGLTCGVQDLRSDRNCGPYFFVHLLLGSILHFDLVRLSIWVPV